MSLANKQLEKIISRLKKTVKDSINREQMNAVGEFATNLIVKRTRLGYGVTDFNTGKKKLAPLSPRYIRSRKMFSGLSGNTSPGKSNLTRTSQMLDSMKHTVIRDGSVIIEPTGVRIDGKRNKDIAQYAHDGGNGRPKRIFNRISKLEFQQTVRFYRKNFADLLRLRKLIT